MTCPPPLAATHPVRPADKGASKGQDHAIVRRTVDALVTVAGCRRKDARERIKGFLDGGAPITELEAYLRQTYRLDPTGVDAVRNVMAGGGDLDAAK